MCNTIRMKLVFILFFSGMSSSALGQDELSSMYSFYGIKHNSKETIEMTPYFDRKWFRFDYPIKTLSETNPITFGLRREKFPMIYGLSIIESSDLSSIVSIMESTTNRDSYEIMQIARNAITTSF